MSAIEWLKRRLQAWGGRVQQKEIERLLAETWRLKAELLEANDGEPIRLTPQEQQRLNELRQGIDPELLARIDLLKDAE